METNERLRVAENLKHLRGVFGYTQADVAEAIFISRSSYSKLECGDQALSMELLLRLSRFYKISIDFIVKSDPRNIVKAKTKPIHGRHELQGLDIIFMQLSSFGKGCLLERAKVLLSSESSS